MKNAAKESNPHQREKATVKGISPQNHTVGGRVGLLNHRRDTLSQASIDNSPTVGAQRVHLDHAYGEAIQRQLPEEEEEELLQGKFAALQRQGTLEEDEEELAQLQRQPIMEEDEEELLQGKFSPLQCQPIPEEEEEELLQGKFAALQRQGILEEDEEELLQGKFPQWADAHLQRKTDSPPNKTGLPDNLKAGIESLSGIDIGDVRVQRNSSKPAQLNALAYTQGSQIHLGPGQERHLPHEAWHAVQQKQGRVKPNFQVGNVRINNDVGLENQADIMGAKALQIHSTAPAADSATQVPVRALSKASYPSFVQRKYDFVGFNMKPRDPLEESFQKATDVVNALTGSNNKYLQFFKTEWGLAQIKLDPSDDKNPGDVSLFYSSEKGNWDSLTRCDDLTELRGEPDKMIYGIAILVRIRKWFFDQYPIGKSLGIIAHEIGVHIVPYMDELMARLPPEAGIKVDERNIDPAKQSGPEGRIDHQRVATIGHVDFDLYRGVVKDMMAYMLEKYQSETGRQIASDLADAYLLDLSTFWLGGRRIPLPLDLRSIAEKYNEYQKAANMEDDVDPKTPEGVKGDYRRLYKAVYPTLKRQHPYAMVILPVLIMIFLFLIPALLFIFLPPL